ncbi:MAG: hypothetical protein ACLFRV_05930 [Acidimicrobiales bacterium]
MTRGRPWDNEADGAALVAALLGGAPRRRDADDAPPGTHDFDIELPDGCVVALEITQHAYAAVLAQRSLEAKLDWTFDNLRYDWVVDVREPCDVKALNREIAEVLSQFEMVGRDRWLENADSLDEATTETLARLQVRLIYRLSEAHPATVIVGSAPAGGATSPDLLIGIAEDHAGRDDNIRKLEKVSDAVERHLLIWVHADHHQLTAAMSLGFLPHAAPQLPDAIDVVWIASAYDRPTVWRVDRSGWSDWTSIARDSLGAPQPPAE